MGRFLPLVHFALCLQRQDGQSFEANEDTLQWKLVMRTNPDLPTSASLALLDQRGNIVLSSAQHCFRGQLWLVGEAPHHCRATAMHGVFGYQKEHTVGSLLLDRSPILTEHWKMSARYLQPRIQEVSYGIHL